MTLYDDALPRFAAIVSEAIGKEKILSHLFLRDAVGRLTFVVLEQIDITDLETIRKKAKDLAPWVDCDTVVATPDDLFDPSLASPSAGLPEFIDTEEFDGWVRLVERRVVGQDWLRPPSDPISGLPPIIVFASHKGGVGRSTALAVSAAALSKAGFNLLVIDLDLEAPGLGTMLLHDIPRFGTLDYFVETGVRDVDGDFLDNLIASSNLTEAGVIHVAPAVGKESEAKPQNVLGKIARAYVEGISEEGHSISFLDRTRSLVSKLCSRFHYDAVFVDARAGLNEATAAAVLGLGAEILLFGADTPQTFAGYRYFLAHLERFRPARSGDSDWRYRIRMVQAKAQGGAKSFSDFRTSAFEMFSDTIYDLEEGIDEDAFNFDYDDINAPHYAWPILNDSNYFEFNPLDKSDQLSDHLYDRTFGFFISCLKDKIGLK